MPDVPENMLVTYSKEYDCAPVLSWPQASLVPETTFRKDRDIVKVNDSGQVLNYFSNLGVSGGAPIANSRIAGIAKEDATLGVAGVMRKVAMISKETVLELPVLHQTPASAVTSLAHRGRLCQLYYDPVFDVIGVNLNSGTIGGTAFLPPLAQTTADWSTVNGALFHWIIVDLSTRYKVGERYGTYLVRPLEFRNVGTGTSSYVMKLTVF